METVLATKVDKVEGKGLSTNDYDDTEKAKVAGAFPRSEQAVLGAKNICSNIPTFTLLKSGDRTKNNTINETPNIGTYKVSFTISDAANITKQGGIQLGDNAGNWSANPDGAFDVVNGRVVLTIPFAHAVSRVYVFLNGNDGDTATATFSDFMITFATDPDPTFAPPAMTNKELTAQFPTKYTSTGLTITNGTISEGGYCKIGNVVLVNIRLQATETGSVVDIVGLPTYTGANKVVCSGANFSDDISAYAYITNGGHLFIKASDVVASKNYVVSGMYLAV